MHAAEQLQRSLPVAGYELESTTPDGEVTVVERSPGETIWSGGEEHSARIVSEAHTIEVEIKSAHR